MSKNLLRTVDQCIVTDIPFLFSVIDSLNLLSKRVPESKVFADALPVTDYETTAGLPLYVFVRIIYNKYFGKPNFLEGQGYIWEGIMVNNQPIGGLKFIYDRLGVAVPPDEPYLLTLQMSTILPPMINMNA